MRDYITIGSTPTEESCAQLGSYGYEVRARIECLAFVRQLKRVYGEPPKGAKLCVKSFQHDYGTYLEVACEYEEGSDKAIRYAFTCENKTPLTWDDEARNELHARGVCAITGCDHRTVGCMNNAEKRSDRTAQSSWTTHSQAQQ